jgi:hypothetical protein
MISSITLLILIHLKIVRTTADPVWRWLVGGGFFEIALFFCYVHWQNKRDLKTNYGRRK